MSVFNSEEIKDQVSLVIKLVQKKIIKYGEKGYFGLLILRLNSLDKELNNSKDLKNLKTKSSLNGAVRAYFETGFPESYSETFVIELDKLINMLNSI